MTTRMRSLRDFRNPIGCLILLAAFAAAAGCSTAETPNGSGTNMNHVLSSGSSVPGWLVVPSGGSHASTATLDYIAKGGSSGCTECHGSDLSGGISNVSCFGNPAGCHHVPVAGWVASPPGVQNHGVSAKKAPGSSGFAACQICHGRDFSGGGARTPCSSCHGVSAPHPARPWRGSTYTHVDTNGSNATVCAQCHFPGSQNNPPNRPAAPAPVGTAPGCFNSTLCHGEANVPHPVGSTWVAASPAAQPHGNDAKATPGATTGYTYCQACHGTGTTFPAAFGGGSSGVSCYPCHGPTVNSPHASEWRTGDTYVHTTTATGNAPVCAFCHLNGVLSPIPPPSPPAPAGTAPGCFNSTLCHGAGGAPHPVGSTWVATSPAAQPHGNSAKATPGSTAGFDYCKVCHGTGNTFTGGTAVSCYPCHGNVGTPHPSQWRTGDTYVHTSTAGGNAPVCAFCHTAGANSPIAPPPAPAPGATPDCFNNTLCHAAGVHPAGWAQSSQHGSAAKAVPSTSGGFSFCKTCHGTGTTPPANFQGGSSGISCYPCHGLNAPHPSSWIGGGPPHRSTDQGQANLDVCAECHRSTAGTAGCFNNTLCHN